jgi:hypothetical protein
MRPELRPRLGATGRPVPAVSLGPSEQPAEGFGYYLRSPQLSDAVGRVDDRGCQGFSTIAATFGQR